MASKLLNVLSTIENSRQNIIETLHEKGYEVLPNSSFEDINGQLQTLPSPHNNVMDIPGVTDLTPETDPDLWHRPEDWPDVQHIFNEQDKVVIDGWTYVPVRLVLFTVSDNDTNLFKVYPSSSGMPTNIFTNPADPTELILGYINYSYNTNDTYNHATFLKFSDGTVSDVFNKDSTNNSTTHTWDTSKDIVLDNGQHLRWFIQYKHLSNANYFYSFISANFTNENCVSIVDAIATNNYENYIGTNGSMRELILMPANCAEYSAIPKSFSGQFYGNWLPGLRSLVIKSGLRRSWTVIQPYYYVSSYPTTQPNTLTQVESEAATDNEAQFKNFNQNSKVLYIQIPFYVADNYRNNSNFYRSKLRYLYIDPEIQQTKTLMPGSLNDLIDTNLFENVVAMDGCIGWTNPNMKVLDMPLLQTITNGALNTFNHCGSQVFNFPKLLDFGAYWQNFTSNTLIEFHAPKLTNVNATVRWFESYALQYVDLSGATTVTSGSSLFYNCPNVRYLNFSSLNSISGGMPWSAIGESLEVLVLPDGFKYDVSFSNCLCLTRTCLLDILNKCAELEEGETYTITLSADCKRKLTEEDIAIATNKGWTVV